LRTATDEIVAQACSTSPAHLRGSCSSSYSRRSASESATSRAPVKS
jgi:hypothetical protein